MWELNHQPCDHGCRKNDAQHHSATLRTKMNSEAPTAIQCNQVMLTDQQLRKSNLEKAGSRDLKSEKKEVIYTKTLHFYTIQYNASSALFPPTLLDYYQF